MVTERIQMIAEDVSREGRRKAIANAVDRELRDRAAQRVEMIVVPALFGVWVGSEVRGVIVHQEVTHTHLVMRLPEVRR